MKQYFVQKTNEEIQFGDILDLALEKRHGIVTEVRHLTCKFMPELVPLLLEEGIIMEKEVKNEKTDTESGSENEFDTTFMTTFFNLMDCMMETFEDLELRVDKLEEKIKSLQKALAIKEKKVSNNA